jgi:hypothetical protein
MRSRPSRSSSKGATIARRGSTAKGEFAQTLNLAHVHAGWVFTRSMRNYAHVYVLKDLYLGMELMPCEVDGLDFGNGSEFAGRLAIAWNANRSISFRRSMPNRKNDQPTIESTINYLIRTHTHSNRYDGPAELQVLSRPSRWSTTG